MAQLIVRNLDDDVKARLQQRAKEHGRSTEAEVREILTKAVTDDRDGCASTRLPLMQAQSCPPGSAVQAGRSKSAMP